MENCVPQNIENESSYTPAVPFLAIYPEDTKTLIWMETYISVFIAYSIYKPIYSTEGQKYQDLHYQ